MQSQDDDKTILGGKTLDLVYSIISENKKKYLIEGGEVIGRGKDCDIFIDDKKISRNHAEINIKNGKLFLKDLGSSNGTFKNGNRVRKELNLSNGDIISFEKHVFTVEISMPKYSNESTNDENLEEDTSDYTAVVDMSEDYLEKLAAASKKEKPPVPETIEDNIPKSWVEETGAVDGTRMMDLGQLEALRAGANVVIKNDSETARLHCFIDGKEEIIELDIRDYSQVSGWEIGRDSSCDIVLAHGSVSNRHAQIIHQNGRWKMVNLVSTNGILINGQKKLTTYLSDGDKIGLGSVNLVFKAAKSAPKSTKINDSAEQTRKNIPVVPVLLASVLIVLAALIYMYLNTTQ